MKRLKRRKTQAADDAKMKSDSDSEDQGRQQKRSRAKSPTKRLDRKLSLSRTCEIGLRRNLPRPKLAERCKRAMADIDSKMRRYFNLKAIHESNAEDWAKE